MARVAIVTGGTRGIGEAVCRALQESGFTVVANYGGNDAKAQQFTADNGQAVDVPERVGAKSQKAIVELRQSFLGMLPFADIAHCYEQSLLCVDQGASASENRNYQNSGDCC